MLDRLLWVAACVVAALAISTVIYHVLPFRRPGERKPGFTLLPKYVVEFDGSEDAVRAALAALKFEQSETDWNRFDRGKVYGDFSANAIKLRIQLDPEARQFTLGAHVFGVLFDTGDLWDVANSVLSLAREHEPS